MISLQRIALGEQNKAWGDPFEMSLKQFQERFDCHLVQGTKNMNNLWVYFSITGTT